MPKIKLPLSGGSEFYTQVPEALVLSTAPRGLAVCTLWARRLEARAGVLLLACPAWCRVGLFPYFPDN